MDIYEEALLGVATVYDLKEVKVYNGEAMVAILIQNGLDVDLARETVELFVQDFYDKCVVLCRSVWPPLHDFAVLCCPDAATPWLPPWLIFRCYVKFDFEFPMLY